MTNPVIEPVCETADELWADDELSDEALDRAPGRGEIKFSPHYLSQFKFACPGPT